MEQSLISIIIPVLNAEKYLSQCISQIVIQQYRLKEVWLIDGNSTDNSLNIIKDFSVQYSFIHYLSEKDNGIYDAMNKGIKLAKGEWLYFTGADDYFVDEHVLQKIFLTTPDFQNANVIYGNVNAPSLGSKYYNGKYNIDKLLTSNICHQAIFYRKKIFDIMGYYDTRLKVHADYLLNIQCFGNKRLNIQYVDVLIANYGGEGLSKKIKDYRFITIKFFYIFKIGLATRKWKQMFKNLIAQFSEKKIKHLLGGRI